MCSDMLQINLYIITQQTNVKVHTELEICTCQIKINIIKANEIQFCKFRW
jgi:hypothetical protein